MRCLNVAGFLESIQADRPRCGISSMLLWIHESVTFGLKYQAIRSSFQQSETSTLLSSLNRISCVEQHLGASMQVSKLKPQIQFSLAEAL
jgi:hypothetical protein